MLSCYYSIRKSSTSQFDISTSSCLLFIVTLISLRINSFLWSRIAVIPSSSVWKVDVSLTLWEDARNRLTIFHKVINISLNRHYDIYNSCKYIKTSWRWATVVYTSSSRWLASFRKIVVLSLAASLFCRAFPHMTYFRRLTCTELIGLSLVESEDLKRDELNTKC